MVAPVYFLSINYFRSLVNFKNKLVLSMCVLKIDFVKEKRQAESLNICEVLLQKHG